eukprot:682508-Rhodomonas_salina.1
MLNRESRPGFEIVMQLGSTLDPRPRPPFKNPKVSSVDPQTSDLRPETMCVTAANTRPSGSD